MPALSLIYLVTLFKLCPWCVFSPVSTSPAVTPWLFSHDFISYWLQTRSKLFFFLLSLTFPPYPHCPCINTPSWSKPWNLNAYQRRPMTALRETRLIKPSIVSHWNQIRRDLFNDFFMHHRTHSLIWGDHKILCQKQKLLGSKQIIAEKTALQAPWWILMVTGQGSGWPPLGKVTQVTGGNNG